jgi:hypothetical protein
MNQETTPSLSEFLAASSEEVAKVAPTTVVYGVGGTRRQAVFLGIEPWSDKYIQWARECTISRADLIFRHGVHNLLVLAYTPDNFQETDQYRDQLFERARWVIAGVESLADYARLGWRVRLLGTGDVPELASTADLLRTATPAQSSCTLYWSFVRDIESPWRQLLAAAVQAQAKTRAEAIRSLYGEDIPPATLYLAFGKPMISSVVIPPLLVGQLQCYWSQQPGYTLSETQLRMILYDYAYVRPTWQKEKIARAQEASIHQTAWEKGPILGLGMRLGPFWYPAPMSSPAWPTGLETDPK